MARERMRTREQEAARARLYLALWRPEGTRQLVSSSLPKTAYLLSSPTNTQAAGSRLRFLFFLLPLSPFFFYF